MTIEQTIDIPSDRRIFFDLPPELPVGRAKIEVIVTPEAKLSDRFAGAMRLSDETYRAFQNDLDKGRNEWARDIY